MIKFLLDLLQLVYSIVPLFFSIAVFVVLALLVAKSLKRHATGFYWVLAVPFVLTLVPFFLGMAGVDVPRLNRVPVLGYFMRDYIHMGTLGFPLLIIIMYMGALDVRHPWVARLMSIRKELSIIVGFPVLTHATLRAFNTFPSGWKFFFDHDEYLATTPVKSVIGAGISSFVFVLGIVMLALFLVLWVTSFTGVRRRLGNRRWKRVQRWAYVLYAMLFIHSIGLQLGGLLNPKQPKEAPKTLLVEGGRSAGSGRTAASFEGTASKKGISTGRTADFGKSSAGKNDGEESSSRKSVGGKSLSKEHKGPSAERAAGNGTLEKSGKGPGSGKGADRRDGKNAEGKGREKGGNSLTDIEIDRNVKRYIHIVSVVLIFGSYLFLRVRKARRSRRN